MAIKPKTIITARLSADCPNHSRTNITVRDTSTIIDEPVERAGTNQGPSPTETGVAALLGCTNTIGNKCAKKLDVDIGHLSIDAVYQMDRRGVLLMEEIEVPYVSIDLTVTCSGTASQADVDRVGAETEKFCALSKLFINSGTKVTVTWHAK